MSHAPPVRRPGFVVTVWLLLAASGRRAAGRRRRQTELLRQRKGKSAVDWGGLGSVMFFLFMAGLNVGAALATVAVVDAVGDLAVEQRGAMQVEPWFVWRARNAEASRSDAVDWPGRPDHVFGAACRREATRLASQGGSHDAAEIEARLLATFRDRGAGGFVDETSFRAGLRGLSSGGAMPRLLGSLVLIWWSVMLVFQGEGLELDIQRRRHPMWEWLLSHPVRPGAVFMAEMLSPLAANPLCQTAPLFVGVLYGAVYGALHGVAAAVLVGVPIAIAASCLGKALEIAAMLRFPPRSRGAVIGLMGWLGYACMALFVFAAMTPHGKLALAVSALRPLTAVPWPWLGLFLGQAPDGGLVFARGVLACLCLAALCVAGSARFTVWAAGRGLSAPAEAGPGKVRAVRFGRNALTRKEVLWLARDRGALVQAILMPVTLAGFQLFNLRGMAAQAQGSWNALCGAAVLLGTYFLWVLGPKSLASDGRALWIATTWPQGLEALLQAKALLWARLSSAIVAVVLLCALYRFPADWWKVLLVGAGWLLFARSMSAKAVTLAAVPSESGETAPIPKGRRAAAQLGMTTFFIGILTQRFDLAVTGIVYSSVTAAAMWQNFRARLPYLFDPWSETLPRAPTLMHAMVAISVLVEVGAVIIGISEAIASLDGPEAAAAALAVAYALSAAAVSFGTMTFLEGRGVRLADIWLWPGPAAVAEAVPASWVSRYASPAFFMPLLAGAGIGAALGLLALGYLTVLWHIPITAAPLHQADVAMRAMPQLRAAVFVIAVLIAPFAEEFLFRGLLFRALDREWGGWRAVLGSAAFFASYHPVLSWLPVAALGVINALIFRRTGRLGPAILTHMVYNAVVLS